MKLSRPVVCLGFAASMALAGCSKPQPPYAVEEVPLSQVSADLAAGKTTAVAVTKAYIDRIKAKDGALHSVIVIAPDALDQAAASDARRKAGKALGALDGIPVLVKDNIDAVGMANTAGSYALIDNKPAKDAEVIRRLREAGVIILGKANLSQFAGFRTITAFNSSTVGGGTHNPYNLDRGTCGSSSGSGAAAAMSFAAAAVGTETDGSVVCPSSTNGLVGIKPTIALVSRRGIVPISHTQDSSGPMGRSVMDVAMLLTAMAGSDPADPASTESDAHKMDYTKGLDAGSLKGARLGVLRKTQGSSDATDPVYNAALEVLKAQGAELVEIPTEQLEDLSQEQLTVLLYDFKQDLAAYLATTGPAVKVRTLADLIAFDKTEEHEKSHAQDVFEMAEATTDFNAPEYKEARETGLRKARTEGIDKWLADNNLSAVIALTNAPGAKIVPDGTMPEHTVTKREDKGDKPPHATTYASIAGYPNLTVPMGLTADGMPLGLTFIGPAWSEQKLLSFGYAFEQAGHKRVPPPALPAQK